MIDIAGTPSWMAPEVTAIELAKGKVPWEDF